MRKYTAPQIENIVEKVVPLIAEKHEHELFKFVIRQKAETCSSTTEFKEFIEKLLK